MGRSSRRKCQESWAEAGGGPDHRGNSPAGQAGVAARPPHPAGASPVAGGATGPQGQCQSVKGQLGSWGPKEELPQDPSPPDPRPLRPLRPSSLARPQAERSTRPRAGDSQGAETKHSTKPVITVQRWAILLAGRVGCTTALEVPGPQVPLLRPPPPGLLLRILHLLACLVPQLRGAGDGRVSRDVLQQDRGQFRGWGLWLLPNPSWISAVGPPQPLRHQLCLGPRLPEQE